MLRQARLDAPDALHHVRVRGLERRVLFREDPDRAACVARLAALAEGGAWTVYAWAVLPTHAHLLVRTGTRPLARSLRRLLTGDAGAFNRRHKRVGHLFQNRDTSVVVEADPHLVERVRYLHLHPLRAQVVPDLRRLDRYPWTGHSALLATVPRPWQATPAVLGHPLAPVLGVQPAAIPKAARRGATHAPVWWRLLAQPQ
jgi:REP element-mobilizing transposase RayT